MCAAADLERYFWLVYALWAGRRFELLLSGSVIEFIHIRDLKKIITEGSRNLEKLDKTIEAFHQLRQLETSLTKQVTLVQLAQKSLLRALYSPP